MKKLLLLPLALLLCSMASAMSDVERRTQIEWMQKNLPDVPAWNEWIQRTGELPPDFDALPRSNLLPDPLRFLDGRPVKSEADLRARKAEIRGLFEKYMTGRFPPKPAIDTVEVLDETHSGNYLVRNVRLIFGPERKGSVRVRLVIPDIPTEGKTVKKMPVLLCPNLDGWAPQLVRRGYISAGFAGNDFMDDAASLKQLYPDYDFATLPRRAWLARIVLDYLETVPQVDAKRIAIFGYSRDGKMATIAAAFDERFSALVAGSTGVGGLVPWRAAGERGGGEGVESTTRMFPDWFAPQLRFFSGREDRLPVDANLFLTLIAPRAVLIEWGNNDQVTNGWSIEQAWQSAQPVFERLGQPNRMGLLHVPGFHGSNDQEACIDWLDIQFGRSKRTWTNDFVFPWNFDQWHKQTGEKIDITKFALHDPAKADAKTVSVSTWAAQAISLRNSINWMLGDTPPLMPPSVPPAGFRRPLPPGPTVVAKGQTGNPGQLSPDVASWVIAAGSQEYGWLEPEKNQVDSRRIRFGSGLVGDLYYPANTPAGKKLPTVVWLHGYHYPLGYMWVYRRDLHPILALTRAGYAVLAYDQAGFGTRFGEAAHFYERYPHWSQMGRMVEDVRAAVDALEKDDLVDASHISLYGYTLGGTVGLYAAALDPRIHEVVSISGFTPMRTDKTSSGTSGMTRFSHERGLMPRLGLFVGNEARLPYDFEDVLALIAPRSVLVVQPQYDRDANPAEVRASVARAQKIYQLLGVPKQLELQEPEDYARLPNATQDRAIEWMKQNLSRQ